jgi:DNA-binding GntR family transcriptional regulator
VRNAYEVKVHLEYLAGFLAAQRITNTQLKKLRRILDEYELMFERGESAVEKDVNFHEGVYRATHNDVLEMSLIKLTSRCNRLCRSLIPQHLESSHSLETLFEIYEALEARNAEMSAKLCQQHSQHYLDLLREVAI